MTVNHFLSIADLTSSEFIDLLDLADSLKREWAAGGNRPILAGKTLAMLFQKPSLRTRVSFEMGMQHLGGHALYISPNEVGLGKRESVADVARVLSSYVDGIMARVFDHAHILELAEHSSVPVINGLSDYNHPAQGLTDIFTIREALGRLQGVRLVFVGDGNNVATSLMFGGAHTGMHVVVCTPQGFEPDPQVVSRARELAQATGATIELDHDPRQAVRGADVIYTDVWTSMGQEAEAQRRLQVFSPTYQVNAELLAASGNPDVRVMHCLPAHRGEEITSEVADSSHSLLWIQAENRMHAQKALLARLLGGL
ncbi:MAG: ornithine carbamoyltransferase [Caldilineae bacterium]|nr:MAG: ornithine carbamoyltransferase [Caldilineae bacterium]